VSLGELAGRVAAMEARWEDIQSRLVALETKYEKLAGGIDYCQQQVEQVSQDLDELAVLVDAIGQLAVEEAAESSEGPAPSEPANMDGEKPPEPQQIPTEPGERRRRRRFGLYAERFGKE
jgi:DNA anti-recombination protein RmuC